ncbi:hypothetical protein C5S36_14050 [Candidatus Methanophagaceae archaeon]|nr:hypothetical protein C5S36_14050 [Methanophagales archaeon]
MQIYLDLMSGLEVDYPYVTFIYMTGHLAGSGEAGNLNQRNNQIRAHCITTTLFSSILRILKATVLMVTTSWIKEPMITATIGLIVLNITGQRSGVTLIRAVTCVNTVLVRILNL